MVANYSGARPWIADYSGLPIETQEWSGQRFVKAWISGQPVQSTVNLDLSGFSVASNVSGNIVYLTSGKNDVQMSGQTVYLASGFNLIQGSFTADISGQPVRVSGQAVRISGETVSIAGGVSVSGNVVVVPSTSISGNVVKISGETVSIAGGINVSGSPVRISGETIYPVSGFAFNKLFDASGVTWNDWWVDASGSNRALVAISGQVVGTSVSGNVLVVPSTSISGNAVVISGQTIVVPSTSISGNVVRISGETVQIAGGVSVSGNMVSISGQPVTVSGNAVRVSGAVFYPVSGNAYLFGFDQSGQTWNEAFMDTSGGHRIKVAISGDTVQIAGGVSVSGNMVSISGQPVIVSGNAVRISGETVSIAGGVSVSGNVVYAVSGQNPVFNYGFIDASGQWTQLRLTQSGQGISGIPHKLPVTFSGDSIIGSVSGNAVAISGQAVLISGQTVVTSVSGIALNISGNVVYLVSGQNPVQLYALDPSGQTLNPLIVNASGSNILRVDAGSIQVSANVSGNVVYLTSGQNAVQISGQPVLISGQLVAVSGVVATNISGNVVYAVSGQNPVFNYGFIDASGQWTQLRVTQSGQGISGIPHKLAVTFSGDSIIGSVSGNMVSISGQAVTNSGVAVRISGSMVSISGQPVSVSGNMVSISGQVVNVSGNVVNTSGNAFVEFGTVLRLNTSGTICTSLSGGTELHSGIVFAVNLRNLSGNAPIYVGGTGSESPFSGKGMLLFSNESQEYRVDNFNRIRVFATTSGQRVRAIAVGQN